VIVLVMLFPSRSTRFRCEAAKRRSSRHERRLLTNRVAWVRPVTAGKSFHNLARSARQSRIEGHWMYKHWSASHSSHSTTYNGKLTLGFEKSSTIPVAALERGSLCEIVRVRDSYDVSRESSDLASKTDGVWIQGRLAQ